MNDNPSFGEYLKLLISKAGLTHRDFYTRLGIKKPYFYDIVSGRINPPPPYLQFKALDVLQANDTTRVRFLDLAANERGECPADIMKTVADSPDALVIIRNSLRNENLRKTCLEENHEHSKINCHS